MSRAAYRRGSRLVERDIDTRIEPLTARIERQALKDENDRLRQAIARLHEALEFMSFDGTTTQARTADLRALLDALSALEAAHTEALDALEGVHKAEQRFDKDGNGAALGVAWGCVLAVLAKAGRR